MEDASIPAMPHVQILYEDNHLIAVVKPPGIPSQEDESGAPDMLTLIKADLKVRHEKPGNVYVGLVHRLDRPVGGVMVFAKTSKAASRLSEAVRTRAFEKCYIAVLSGVPVPNEGSLTHYLRKDARSNIVTAFETPKPNAKEAVLDYRVFGCTEDTALVSIRLHTGRSHQIRVQMAAIGCPLVGDLKYSNLNGGWSKRDSRAESPALWSASVGVAHPVTKEWLTFKAAPPAESPWSMWKAEQLESASAHFRS